MSNSSHSFTIYFSHSSNEIVRIVDESFIPIIEKVSIKISKNIALKFVLHVPKRGSNILFVSNTTENPDNCVVFYKSLCEIYDYSSGMMIDNARKINGLYYLDTNVFSNKKVHNLRSVSSLPSYDQIILWHHRLRHPSFLYLKHLFTYLFKIMNVSCYLYFKTVLCFKTILLDS